MSSDDRSRALGKVISVSADRFVVELHRGSDNFTVVGFDDVHYVARLGSFVLMPVQSEYVVAEVIGLREKDSSAPRTGDETGAELDKALSAKYLDLVPVGMLPFGSGSEFRFGVSVFPSLYADALYTTDGDLDRIFQVAGQNVPFKAKDGDGIVRTGMAATALTVGTSVVFKGYPVKVRIDDFFGGHTAVLGNTGSGKSCTVATIIQSLFEKPDEFAARGASFVILDVNGEYRSAFEKLPDKIARLYLRARIDPSVDAPEPNESGREVTGVFRLPHWFMSVEEWELLLRASERTQQPVLRMALGLTELIAEGGDASQDIRNHILAMCVRECFQGSGGDSPVSKRHRAVAILERFEKKGIT